MSFRLRIALAVMWLCCACALSAQIGFSMPFINGAATGSNKSLTVKVTNFDSIVSMQYVIRWDPTVLKYLTIDNFGAVPTLGLTHFNAANALDSGYVKLQWEGPNFFPGVSVPDGTAIFRMRFNIIGPDTSSTIVKFTEITNTSPFIEFEVLKVVSPNGTIQAFDEHHCTLTHGFVAVGYTVATAEPTIQDALELTVAPNPITENTRADFFLEQTADVQILIADATGRIVFQKELPNLPSGKNGIDLDKAIFPAKGAYFLTVRAGSEMSVRPMICN